MEEDAHDIPAFASYVGPAPLRIGNSAHTGYPLAAFVGIISHVMIWNISLSNSDVAQWAATYHEHVSDPNLMGFWQLTDGAFHIVFSHKRAQVPRIIQIWGQAEGAKRFRGCPSWDVTSRTSFHVPTSQRGSRNGVISYTARQNLGKIFADRAILHDIARYRILLKKIT